MLFFPPKKRVEATQSARSALGLPSLCENSPGIVKELAEKAVSQALTPTEFVPGREAPAPRPAPTSIPSDPNGHLNFAKRTVAHMGEEESRLLAAIEEERAAHSGKIAALEAGLANVRKTRAFYETAPDYLSPATPAADPAPEGPTTPAEPEVAKPPRSRRAKAAQVVGGRADA